MVTLVLAQIVGARLPSLVPTAIFLRSYFDIERYFYFFSRICLIFQGLPVGLLFYFKWV